MQVGAFADMFLLLLFQSLRLRWPPAAAGYLLPLRAARMATQASSSWSQSIDIFVQMQSPQKETVRLYAAVP